MVQSKFVEFVTDVFDYFERKRPNDNTMDLWFDEVRNIPDEPLEWIKGKIFKENDNKPSNLPATMWALYNAWLQANPHKRAFTEEKDCPDCEGGWLVLQKQIAGYRSPISHSAPCGRCRQIPAAKYMTLAEAIKAGYERTDLRSAPWDGRSVKEMAQDIARRKVEKPGVFAE
jgi:hypothetical protein